MPHAQGTGLSSGDYEDEHEAFAASRSTDYIYEPGNDAAFAKLDCHAEAIDGDAKLPFVITGSPGCGKSALLANWINRRRQLKHRDEFLFQHFVGCSPRSKRLAHLLYRLESALKEHYQLREMEVPSSEERLRWSLNRFLAAAAKKHCPARIVIVLDAVNQLRGDSSAADTLHWLPTTLPHGVHIIVATAEFERYGMVPDDGYDEGSRIHRTYTELQRRKCPTLRLEPLTVEIRHQIIGSFVKANEHALCCFEQAQQFRLVTAKASSQPLFLRTLLYSLRLGFEISEVPVDQQLDVCLCAQSSSQLIACVLELCSFYVDKKEWGGSMRLSKDKSQKSGVNNAEKASHGRECVTSVPSGNVCGGENNALAQILTALYTSRHGLSEPEMWGLVELSSGGTLPSEQRKCIQRVLRDFTFSVKGLWNFSHEDYAAVVYAKYIRSPEVHVRAHNLMARYFGKLPPCHRKLDALPYHLEVSGSWLRLRGALVDVRMFRLWWTPSHKTEFLNLWASLTACSNTSAPIRKLVTGEFDDTMRFTQPLRPCLDIVEEYVRSVDDYKYARDPTDDDLAVIVLRIADFMLEFATLCREEAADVPQFVHPAIPNDDLASLGVPFLAWDKDGNSVLSTPYIERAIEKRRCGSKHNALDTPMKIHEEIPVCSTYFYHRWMWIQFPLVSLANCGERYLKGVVQHVCYDQPDSSATPATSSPASRKPVESASSDGAVDVNLAGETALRPARSKLPGICPERKDRATQVHYLETTGTTGVHNKGTKRRMSNPLRRETCNDPPQGKESSFESVSASRNELVMLRQVRLSLLHRARKLRYESCELRALSLSVSNLKTRMEQIAEYLTQVNKGKKMAKLVCSNYECVRLMCERHPAHSQALIDELEAKLYQDVRFIKEVRQRLTNIKFKSHDFTSQNRALQRAVCEMSLLRSGLLSQRFHQREQFAASATASHRSPSLHSAHSGLTRRATDLAVRCRPRNDPAVLKREYYSGAEMNEVNCYCSGVQHMLLEHSGIWEEHSEIIRKRTFILGVKDFFAKFYNAHSLQSQMRSLHCAAELRHRDLKTVLSDVDAELEQVRYDSQSAVGSKSREARDLQTRVNKQSGRHKRAREAALTAERLRQDAYGGIKHVCSILGIPPPDLDTPVNEIMHHVESVLEALIEERDKSTQKNAESHQVAFRANSPGYDKLMRSPELDAALENFETPKAMIAHKLPSRSADDSRVMHEDTGFVDLFEECESS